MIPMSMYDQQSGPGSAHGKTSPLRIDPSTVLALIVLAALAVMAGLHFAFKVGVSAGVSR
jgi:hypothetical protein